MTIPVSSYTDDPLFDGDLGELSEDARRGLVSILKRRLVSAETNKRAWACVCPNTVTRSGHGSTRCSMTW